MTDDAIELGAEALKQLPIDKVCDEGHERRFSGAVLNALFSHADSDMIALVRKEGEKVRVMRLEQDSIYMSLFRLVPLEEPRLETLVERQLATDWDSQEDSVYDRPLEEPKGKR